MRIFLAGATGRTGKYILKAALARGHEVTALVRGTEDRLGITDAKLKVVEGDLLITTNLERMVVRHDAIITALSSSVVEAATSKLIAAADTANVQRFIGLAGGGILQLDAQTLRRDRANYPEVFRKSSEGHMKAWKALEASGLEWTLICTPDLLDAPSSGQAEALADYMPAGKNSVPRGDVAELMLDELENPKFPNHRVGFTSKLERS